MLPRPLPTWNHISNVTESKVWRAILMVWANGDSYTNLVYVINQRIVMSLCLGGEFIPSPRL